MAGDEQGCGMLDLNGISARIEAGEKFEVRYRIEAGAGGRAQERRGVLLDVAEESDKLFVSTGDGIIWVSVDEVIDVLPDGSP